MDGQTDLLLLAIGGDRAALEGLIARDHSRLLQFVSRIHHKSLGGWAEPTDILQEAYIEVYRGIERFKPDGEDAFYRWVATIARSRMLDHVKAANAFKRRGAQLQPEEQPVSDLLEQLAVSKRTPSQSAAGHELFQKVNESIEMLPSDYRRILQLRHDQQLSPPQAAEQMQRGVGAAQMLYSRALAALREKLRSKSLYL